MSSRKGRPPRSIAARRWRERYAPESAGAQAGSSTERVSARDPTEDDDDPADGEGVCEPRSRWGHRHRRVCTRHGAARLLAGQVRVASCGLRRGRPHGGNAPTRSPSRRATCRSCSAMTRRRRAHSSWAPRWPCRWPHIPDRCARQSLPSTVVDQSDAVHASRKSGREGASTFAAARCVPMVRALRRRPCPRSCPLSKPSFPLVAACPSAGALRGPISTAMAIRRRRVRAATARSRRPLPRSTERRARAPCVRPRSRPARVGRDRGRPRRRSCPRARAREPAS